MKYVGIYTQQHTNNIKSLLLLMTFPLLMLALVWLFFAIFQLCSDSWVDDYENVHYAIDWYTVNQQFITTVPWVILVVGIWFMISYFSNTSVVRQATGARPLTRKENPRVYNIVENLTMTCGMPMPKINVIDDPQLNAFASGIDQQSYTVTVTTGICDRLDDEELSGVIGHELTHIRNHDTRLLIISIVFVGIMSTIMQMAIDFAWRTLVYGGGRSRNRSNGSKGGAGILVAVAIAAVLAIIGFFFTILTRFAISRRREYMADAGGAELCGNPLALASALRKISSDTALGSCKREDVAQLFICRPQFTEGFTNFMSDLFSTHPSTESRIKYLEQF